jgi:hypothetical protein
VVERERVASSDSRDDLRIVVAYLREYKEQLQSKIDRSFGAVCKKIRESAFGDVRGTYIQQLEGFFEELSKLDDE